MQVLDSKELEKRRQKRGKRHKQSKHTRHTARFLLLIVLAYLAVCLLTPQPNLTVNASGTSVFKATPVSMPWPTYGQAAVGAVGYGLLAKHGDQVQLPTASVAKVITALAVLKVRPIEANVPEATITITKEDVAAYNQAVAEGQSVVAVKEGEVLTEYQALQALLLPSANNMADVLAVWAFGSMGDYVTFVNPFTKTIGMQNTHIDDASGFSAKTVSTAEDLTKLAEIAMNHPIISEIVNQAEADLPVTGTVTNVNRLVGQEGIVGIKTGNTDEAGGCYLFSVKRKVLGNQEIVVVGTVMGAPNLTTAIDDALPLIDETYKNFQEATPIETGQVVGEIRQPGGVKVPMIVQQSVRVTVWSDQAPRAEVTTSELGTGVRSGDQVGIMKLHIGNMTHELPLIAQYGISKRSAAWKVTHPLNLL